MFNCNNKYYELLFQAVTPLKLKCCSSGKIYYISSSFSSKAKTDPASVNLQHALLSKRQPDERKYINHVHYLNLGYIQQCF